MTKQFFNRKTGRLYGESAYLELLADQKRTREAHSHLSISVEQASSRAPSPERMRRMLHAQELLTRGGNRLAELADEVLSLAEVKVPVLDPITGALPTPGRVHFVDPYSLCPCGSGKKFKFCCKLTKTQETPR